MSSIRLSAKHGVNPSLIVCVWCGKDGAIALQGRLPGDAEAPKRVVMNYEPCSECATGMNQGITVIEMGPEQTVGLPAFAHGEWPTGRWSVLRREAAERLFGSMSQWKAIERTGKMFMDRETYEHFGFPAEAKP